MWRRLSVGVSEGVPNLKALGANLLTLLRLGNFTQSGEIGTRRGESSSRMGSPTSISQAAACVSQKPPRPRSTLDRIWESPLAI